MTGVLIRPLREPQPKTDEQAQEIQRNLMQENLDNQPLNENK